MILKYIKDRIQGKAPAGAKRSSQWPKVRKEHLSKNPLCAVCGSTKKVEVHHMIPFHENPLLELEPSNLITLCEAKKKGINCHLLVGHLGNYRGSNPDVLTDSQSWSEKLNKPKPEPAKEET